MQRYSVDVGTRDQEVVLAVHGEVDLSTAPHLMDTILRAAQAHPGWPVVVDAAGMGFIDSSGIRALVLAREALEQEGSSVRIENPVRATRRVLEVTGLDSFLLSQPTPPLAAPVD